jgi:hypothetical protein
LTSPRVITEEDGPGHGSLNKLACVAFTLVMNYAAVAGLLVLVAAVTSGSS